MHTNTLSDLIEIHTEGTPMSDFLPDDAIHVWWTSCRTSRIVNQTPRKAYKPSEPVPSSSTTSTSSLSTHGDISSEGSSSSDEADDNNCTIALDEWDKWFMDD